MRDAEEKTAGLPLTQHPAVPKKKKNKEKASVKISTSLKVKTCFTWEPQSVTVQSDSLAGPDQPTVSTCSHSEERVVRDIMSSS